MGDESISVLDRRGDLWLTWDLDEITAVAIDDYAGMKSRLTATRFIVMGALAFFVPKRTTVTYLSIESPEHHALIEIPNVAPPALRAQLRGRLPESRQAATPEPPPPPPSMDEAGIPQAVAIADRLNVLDALLADGAITTEEHASRRTAILDSI